jgi:hypothetical protein
MTRQKLPPSLCALRLERDADAEAVESGRRFERKRRGEREGASGQSNTKRTVHAAWWSGPRPSGSTRDRITRSRADAGGHSNAALRRGRPQGDGASEVRRLNGRSEKTILRHLRSVRRSGPFGVNRRLSHRVGNAMRRAPRHGALVFENNIRELQTSVEWTGVAAGSLPRVPGSPSRRAGRPARGGGLARRALRTSDVARRQSTGQTVWERGRYPSSRGRGEERSRRPYVQDRENDSATCSRARAARSTR